MKSTQNQLITVFFLVLFMLCSGTQLNAQTADNQKDIDYSDVRLSKNVEPINGALKKLGTAKGVYYNYNTNEFPDLQLDTLRHIGIMAQDLQAFPELIETGADGYKSVDYEQMVPLLLEAIKELKAENIQLNAKYIYLINSLSQSGVLDKNFGKKPEEKK